MPYNPTTNSFELTKLMTKLQSEKKAGIELQKHKHEDWNDNYELDRGKTKTNRLTQRQAVNIPLMKETRKTMLSKIDDPPNVDWSEKAGDEFKELIYQEMWNDHLKKNNLEIIDVLDKNNVLLYGHSYKWLSPVERGIECSVSDPFDVVIDPLTLPWDIESARYIIRQNIFKTVRDIIADPKYSEKGKEDLKIWADTSQGILQSSKVKEEFDKKLERLKALGTQSGDFALYAGGDMLVNLSEHFTKIWDGKKFEKRVIIYANDTIELYNESLIDCIGVDFWPTVRWSEDPDINDVYPDSIADLVRVPNKVINVWYSQLIENRTLKNFQMHWIAASGDYTPQTYTPGPGMQLPAPPLSSTGRISDVIQPVEISGLDDTMGAIQALTQIVERGTGATAIEKGQPESGQQTLGEIQILVGKAGERTTAMAKFYRRAWYEYAVKWSKMMMANSPKLIKLYRQGPSGKTYEKKVFPSDWKSVAGYEPKVSSTSEQEANEVKTIQKWMFVKQQFPNNQALNKIAQKRQLELLDLTPEELKEVEDAENQAMQLAQVPQQPQPQQSNNDTQQLTDKMNQLQQQLQYA